MWISKFAFYQCLATDGDGKIASATVLGMRQQVLIVVDAVVLLMSITRLQLLRVRIHDSRHFLIQFCSCKSLNSPFIMPCDRWEDSISNGTGNETTGYNSGGRGRRYGARGRGTSFVSATGEPVSGLESQWVGEVASHVVILHILPTLTLIVTLTVTSSKATLLRIF